MKQFILKYKYILLAIIIAAALFFFIKEKYGQYIVTYYNPEAIKNWILSFGSLSFMIFMLLQIIQVVLFFIPGEVVQAAGGYIYGTLAGAGISLLGATLGAIITFLIARRYGDRLLKRILPRKDYEKTRSLIDRPKNKLILFILYLIPGFPKDVLGYVAGITPIRLRWFIIFSTIARIPGIIMSTYIGSSLYEKNYLLVIITIVLMVILLVIGLWKGDKILEKFKIK